MDKIVISLFILIAYCYAENSTPENQDQKCRIPKKIATLEWDGSGQETDGFYVPLGAKSDTNLTKEMLHGVSLNPDEDLVKLCTRVVWNTNDTKFSVTGNINNTIQFNCKQGGGNSSWTLDCKQDKKEEQKTNAKDYDHTAYVTLTDKKTFVVIVRCWKNGEQGWSVLSTKKTLQGDVEVQILEHVKALGFDTAEALPLSYKKCKQPTS